MKRLVSLSIIIIAALIFWGSQTWEKKKAITHLQSSDPHYVDVFIQDFTLTAMSDDGKPAYILKAKRLEHYNDSNYAVINEPVIQLKQGDHRWLISANSGEIDDENQIIILRNSVVLQQQDKAQPIRLETEQLEIDTRQQIAKSMHTVSIIQQEFTLQSKGMILDNASGQLELLNSVTGRYVQAQ
ncbi:MAG: LPS export ABC transporter periplasmic protein LptC [Gammaproteobacteria bacterium]|nr:LPS export ABC transporter periplasmic protein LptC [Gammaproteobacteria bacterium]